MGCGRSTRRRGGRTAGFRRDRRRTRRMRCWSSCSRANCAKPHGAGCRRRRSSSSAWHTTSCRPTTPTRPPGTRSAGAAGQPARLCAHGFRRARSVGGGRGPRRRWGGRRRKTAVSDDPRSRRARRRARPRRVRARAAGCRCGEYRQDEAVDFAIVGTGAGGGTLACRLAEAGFSVVALERGRAFARWKTSPPTRRSRPSSTGPTTASSTARTRCTGQQQQRQGGRRQHRPFRDGIAAIQARVVQIAHAAGLRRGLAARLAGDVALLRRGRGRAENRGPVSYPWGPPAAALPVSRARDERAPRSHSRKAARRSVSNGPKRRWLRSRRRAAGAPLRLSRLLHERLLHQRQAERPGDVDPARDRGRRGNPRPRDGRAHRGQRRRPRDRRSLSPRGTLAFQKARNVVVAGYAIETPRLLLNSATARFPTASPTAPAWSAGT